jgi:hypothetical protein
MFDPKMLRQYARDQLNTPSEDIQHSLNLFQRFKRLYEKNPSLLSEILALEEAEGQASLRPGNFFYILGLVTNHQALLVTNLMKGRSQIFLGAQRDDRRIWTIGRDPSKAALVVSHDKVSRCHATVCYDSTNGFILHDNNSTNGAYVNGVRIRRSHMLQDDDRVRLASLKFGFFRSSEYRRAKSPTAKLLQSIEAGIVPPTIPIETDAEAQAADQDWSAGAAEDTLYFLKHPRLGETNSASN